MEQAGQQLSNQSPRFPAQCSFQRTLVHQREFQHNCVKITHNVKSVYQKVNGERRIFQQGNVS